MVTKNTHLTWL